MATSSDRISDSCSAAPVCASTWCKMPDQLQMSTSDRPRDWRHGCSPSGCRTRRQAGQKRWRRHNVGINDGLADNRLEELSSRERREKEEKRREGIDEKPGDRQ